MTATILPKRKCKYCKGTFQPLQRKQTFCCDNHRKSFWQYGTMTFEKLEARVEKEARRVAREEFQICLRIFQQNNNLPIAPINESEKKRLSA
jgi:hypothetical protein